MHAYIKLLVQFSITYYQKELIPRLDQTVLICSLKNYQLINAYDCHCSIKTFTFIFCFFYITNYHRFICCYFQPSILDSKLPPTIEFIFILEEINWN